MGRFEKQIEAFTLVPSDGGRFELYVDGEQVFSKRQLGRHAEPGELVQRIEDFLAKRGAA